MLIAKGYQISFQGDKNVLKLTMVMAAHIPPISISCTCSVAQSCLTLCDPMDHGR